jgi:acetyl esterase
MALDEDTQAFIAAVAQLGIKPMNQMTLQELRAFAASRPQAGPALHEVRDISIPGPVGLMAARLYRPNEGSDLPILVYLHGGGWVMGTLDTLDETCRTLANAAGCLVLSIDYPLAPENKFPVPVEGAHAAFNWTVEHAAELGGDPQRVAIGGDSAGANLSAAVCLKARDEGTAAPLMQLLVYPATVYRFDLPSMIENADLGLMNKTAIGQMWDYYMRAPEDAQNPYLAPANAQSHASLPPALVITGEHDPLRDDGLEYVKLLEKAGTPVDSKLYPGVLHGFWGIPSTVRRGREAIEDAATALRKAFGT